MQSWLNLAKVLNMKQYLILRESLHKSNISSVETTLEIPVLEFRAKNCSRTPSDGLCFVVASCSWGGQPYPTWLGTEKLKVIINCQNSNLLFTPCSSTSSAALVTLALRTFSVSKTDKQQSNALSIDQLISIGMQKIKLLKRAKNILEKNNLAKCCKWTQVLCDFFVLSLLVNKNSTLNSIKLSLA